VAQQGAPRAAARRAAAREDREPGGPHRTQVQVGVNQKEAVCRT
jgi:hypothetical protein